MSEIDKLVNQAFPDELRRVEPVEVDEDAILALTLQKLGLEQEEAGQEHVQQKPSGKHMRGVRTREKGQRKARPVRQPRLVEAPPEPEQRFVWLKRVTFAVAACLVLGIALRWGPWVLESVGFGTGNRVTSPRAAGDTVSGGVNVIELEGIRDKIRVNQGIGTETTTDSAVNRVPVGETDARVAIDGVYFDEDEEGFSVSLIMDGMTTAEIGRYEFIATDLNCVEILRNTDRYTSTGEVNMAYNSATGGEKAVNLFVFKLASDEPGKYEYQLVKTYTILLNSGDVYIADDVFDLEDLYANGIFPGSEEYNNANRFEDGGSSENWFLGGYGSRNDHYGNAAANDSDYDTDG